ncbi:hypothetical protein LNGFDJGK_01632 [Enterobacter hormaechei]|nr:hypothetical protein LNGFDJGK_01632 [Enterobacter hormaechei]CQR76783.1 hypothetical protein BN1385_01638 [Enterobacter hormaechei]VAC88270.1 Uncharacterised protein [Enterobacter hormaechei]
MKSPKSNDITLRRTVVVTTLVMFLLYASVIVSQLFGS